MKVILRGGGKFPGAGFLVSIRNRNLSDGGGDQGMSSGIKGGSLGGRSTGEEKGEVKS